MGSRSGVTIKDIARELNVSISTVSRSLSGNPSISEATRNAVLEAAERLNYEPNKIATGLRRGRTQTIGVVIPEIVHFFFSTVISGIEDAAHENGYSVILSQSNEEYNREVANVKMLYDQRIDGLLIDVAQNTRDFEHITNIKEKGVPVVFFDRLIEGLKGSKVVTDDYAGAYLATNHLINLGYTRIAHLAGLKGLSITTNRLEGYKKALIDGGLGIDQNLIVFGVRHSIDESKEMAKTLLQRRDRPQAIFAVNDPAALGILTAAKELGIVVPDELSVIGFSNWQVTQYTNPTITTVDQPGYEVGYNAAKMLIRQIEAEDDQPIPTETMVIDAKLIVRESAPQQL